MIVIAIFVGLVLLAFCAGLLTLVRMTKPYGSDVPWRVPNSRPTLACPLGATTHNVMVERRGRCPGCTYS